MAVRESECANATTLNCFPDNLVHDIDGSPFRAVNQRVEQVAAIPAPYTSDQKSFVEAHKDELMVATWTRTSVNHLVGQRRAVTGNEAWQGRTLQELVAEQHGAGFLLPNVHLSSGTGFNERGTDDGLRPSSYGEAVSDPGLWPLALSGSKGLARAVRPKLIQHARSVRDGVLDPRSAFFQTFGESPRIGRWLANRGDKARQIEQAGLIDQLFFLSESDAYPLSEFGLSPSPSARVVQDAFPNASTDPLEAQAALAFLLLKYRVSVSVTLGPSASATFEEGVDLSGGAIPEGGLVNPPIAFDFSHQGNRSVQAMMWDRVFGIAARLKRLLKNEEMDDGSSMWDHTLLYFATDFGRTKQRPENAPEFGTGHDLNNAVVFLSPLVNGNRILGGLDPDTGLTHGFDPVTGEPAPDRHMTEAQIFSGICSTLGLDLGGSGLPPVPAMRKGA
jgi:hypothetical protein